MRMAHALAGSHIVDPQRRDNANSDYDGLDPDWYPKLDRLGLVTPSSTEANFAKDYCKVDHALKIPFISEQCVVSGCSQSAVIVTGGEIASFHWFLDRRVTR